MKTYRELFIFLIFLSVTWGAVAQQSRIITGKVTGSYHNDPIIGAIISVQGQSGSVTSDSLGQFSIEVKSIKGLLQVWAPGYYDVEQPVLGRNAVNIVMMSVDRYRYNQNLVLPGMSDAGSLRSSLAQNINEKNMYPGAYTLDETLGDNLTGLQIIKKSGMPGEGSYLNMRGIRSLAGKNSPLIVLNGMPYFPDMNESPIIGGYSSNMFNSINVNDIENISFLKGAETSLYGSLGSNGVILIETKKATDMETKIEFTGQYGVACNTKKYPLLGIDDFKSYIGDIGLTKYSDMGDVLALFPFLKDDPSYYYKFLYNNNTNWQSKIYNTAIITDADLRVKGGDAIAKYDLSVGYLSQDGVLKNTNMSRYNTRLNASITLSKDLELFSSFGFSYVKSDLQEQGMLEATNPLLTTLYEAPILNPYKKDEFNHQLPAYDIVRQFNVSNPLALVNTVKMSADVYDVTLNSGFNYHLTNDFRLTGMFGLFYNYNRQSAFVPGKTSGSIVALDDSVALNTERAGVGQNLDLFFNFNTEYTKSIGNQSISTGIGWQTLMNHLEFDAGKGRNTSSDFYKSLSYVESAGRSFWGYIDQWNWMNLYGFLNYDFNKQIFASVNVSSDGSSSGTKTKRFGLFPSGKLTWRAKNTDWFQNSKLINKLDLHADYGVTGNSQFSSNLGKYYYLSLAYRDLSGVVVGNYANNSLSGETTTSLDLGIEWSVFRNRLQGTVDVYNSTTDHVLMSKPISPVNGVDYEYGNGAKIGNKGLELSLQAGLVALKDFDFIVGGTLNVNKNELKNLGGESQQITTLGDGASIISRVGQPVYSYYGYVSEGVFASQTEADAAALNDYKGNKFNAGDIHFKDVNGDHIIDNNDCEIIGNANPKYFGGFYGNIRYKRLSLTADFTYSVGNHAYNAVRRSLEAMKNFYNQSAAVTHRWQTDGQSTDIPKATYGDPMENNRFSDRWIENASYVRLNNITLSYKLKEKTLKFIREGSIFISGENLFTLTDYLGLDPVNSYSYDPLMQGMDYAKMALPRTVKFGIKLQL